MGGGGGMKRVGRGEGGRGDASDGKWTRIRVTPLHSHQSLNSEGGEDERKGMGGKKKKKNALNSSKSGKQQQRKKRRRRRSWRQRRGEGVLACFLLLLPVT